jgi:dTDP-4-dehydrorhamnose reductase
MRILITGATGRLGTQLVQRLQKHDLIQTGKNELDITDWHATRRFIDHTRPELVLHPAAWTDVDGCAREPERAVLVNGYGAGHVAMAAAAVGATILYISSNEVFDGKAYTPYREYDPTAPTNPYAYSKWVGEQMVRSHNPRHMIVRTAWLFAHGGKNFIQTILNAAQAGKPLRVVQDEIGNPTYTNDLADAAAVLITIGRYGIYHFVNEGDCSRYDFARFILDSAGHSDTPITPITQADWQRPSNPPAYSALANDAGRSIGITLRPWQEAVTAFIEKEGLR